MGGRTPTDTSSTYNIAPVCWARAPACNVYSVGAMVRKPHVFWRNVHVHVHICRRRRRRRWRRERFCVNGVVCRKKVRALFQSGRACARVSSVCPRAFRTCYVVPCTRCCCVRDPNNSSGRSRRVLVLFPDVPRTSGVNVNVCAWQLRLGSHVRTHPALEICDSTPLDYSTVHARSRRPTSERACLFIMIYEV